VLRGVFGPKKKGVSGCQRKVHGEELHNLFFSPNILTEKNERGLDKKSMLLSFETIKMDIHFGRNI
jgi:hypothetical protein